MRKLCCADVIRYFVASVGSSRIWFKVVRPSKKLGMSSSSWRRLACPIGTISLLLNENPKRANSRKKLRFLNGCLFLCCLRRGVIVDAPPLHSFLQESWRPARWQQPGSVVEMVLLETSRCPFATQRWNRFGETCGLCYTFLCAEQHIYVGTYLSHLFPYIYIYLIFIYGVV